MNLFFSIHYPHQLKQAGLFSGNGVDGEATVEGFQTFVNRRFFPWVKAVQHLQRIDGFSLQLCISGTVLQLMQAFNPAALQALKEVVVTGNVVFIATTYYNSITSLLPKEEPEEQIKLHRNKIAEIFEAPTVIINRDDHQSLPETVLPLAHKLASLETMVKETGDEKRLQHWRLLQDKAYYTTTNEVLLRKHLTAFEALLMQRKLSTIRLRYPQHTFLL